MPRLFLSPPFIEVPEKTSKTISETSDYTDFKKITHLTCPRAGEGFFRWRFDLCNLPFSAFGGIPLWRDKRRNHKDRPLQRSLESGSILIVSLWAFGVLSILSLCLASFVFQEIRFTNFFIRSTLSLPLAKGALQRLFEEKRQDGTPGYDTLEELKEERIQTLCGNIAYKYYFVDKKIIDGQEKIIDESALININVVSNDVFGRLPGLDKDLAQEIVNSSRRPFKLKEELLLVDGITKDSFNKFKDLITVYGNGKININTVSSDVLSALGLDDDLTERIMRYRQEYEGIDGKQGTEDDGAFINPTNILSDLRRFTSLTLRQEQDLLSIMNLLDVKSRFLSFNVIPQVKAKDGTHYSIVICPDENKIISWQEQ